MRPEIKMKGHEKDRAASAVARKPKIENASDPITDFADAVREYRDWLQLGREKKHRAVQNALKHLTRLMALAIEFPKVRWGKVGKHHWSIINKREIELYRRAKLHPVDRMPFNHYQMIFDPLDDPPDSVCVGSLSEDLFDIESDLFRGLIAFDLGYTDCALMVWKEGFYGHWGQHCTSAIYALRYWLDKNWAD